MATTFTITNTLKADEPIEVTYGRKIAPPVDNVPYSGDNNSDYAAYNPGSQTGPKASNYKFNTIMLPVPLTNLQVAIPADDGTDANVITLVANTLIEEEFYKTLQIPGLTIVPETTAGEGD